MVIPILKVVGTIAGIGGIAVGVLLIIFRDIIRKNIFPNLTKIQAYKLLRLIVILCFIVAILGITCWTFVTIKGKPPPIDKEEGTSLTITMLKNGWLHVIEKGRIYEFTLSNPLIGLAIVESIAVEVLDVIEDHFPQQEGIISNFSYRLAFDPEFRGRRVFAEGFKYTAEEVDRFSVLFQSSVQGYDYFFRFVVVWHDPLKKEKNESYSDILVARFPSSGIPYENGGKEVRRKFEEHNERVWAHKEKLLSELSKKL